MHLPFQWAITTCTPKHNPPPLFAVVERLVVAGQLLTPTRRCVFEQETDPQTDGQATGKLLRGLPAKVEKCNIRAVLLLSASKRLCNSTCKLISDDRIREILWLSELDDTYWFAALQFEGSVLPQFVVQVVEEEAERGRSLVERHMEVWSQLRHVEGLWLPDCTDRNKTKPPFFWTYTVCTLMIQLTISSTIISIKYANYQIFSIF